MLECQAFLLICVVLIYRISVNLVTWTKDIDRIYFLADQIGIYVVLTQDKRRRATRWPHIDLWRHCNVKMTSLCCISAYSRFSRSYLLCFSYINEVLSGEHEK